MGCFEAVKDERPHPKTGVKVRIVGLEVKLQAGDKALATND